MASNAGNIDQFLSTVWRPKHAPDSGETRFEYFIYQIYRIST
jgi:hypothetical protein